MVRDHRPRFTRGRRPGRASAEGPPDRRRLASRLVTRRRSLVSLLAVGEDGRRMRLQRDPEIALARRLLLVVGLAYLAAQLLVFSLDRPPSWDEAIYLSQVAPGAEALPFVPSRARGITFLALPVLQLGGSLPQLRVFLAVASAAALIASFRMWVPVLGLGAVAAAVLYAGSWPALFYGS